MKERTVPCHRPEEKVKTNKRKEEGRESAEKKCKGKDLSWVNFVGKLNSGYQPTLFIHAFISETLLYLAYGVLKEAVP